MRRGELNSRYFNWLCQLSMNWCQEGRSYGRLLHFLNGVEFYYTMPMDGNRESDGIDLRYRFGYENGYEEAVIANLLDDHPCTVLEMMVALSIRCENEIMSDPDFDDRTRLWFWEMVESLGLDGMDDRHFDEEYANDVIDRFLSHGYERNGKGGLFIIKDEQCDMRRLEIWKQMYRYLNEVA